MTTKQADRSARHRGLIFFFRRSDLDLLDFLDFLEILDLSSRASLQKGGVPAAPSGTATLLRLSPNHQFYPRPVIPVCRHPRLSWLDGRCVQGPGTYSPRHG